MNNEQIKKLAEDHVDWYLSAIKPRLIDHMMHGYKHGYEDCRKENNIQTSKEKDLKCPWCKKELNILYLPEGAKIVKQMYDSEK